MPVPILFEAYRFTLGSALEKINRELMSDYGKLDSEYRQCVKKSEKSLGYPNGQL